MKKILVLASAFLLVGTLTQAQSSTRVYGPKAKNEKVWVNKSEYSKPVTTETERVTGGAAKNQKVWVNNSNATQVEVQRSSDNERVQGPRAKNQQLHKRLDKKQVR